MTTLLIARLTFDEALRRKLIWAVLFLSAVFLGLYAFGFQILRDDIVRFDDAAFGGDHERNLRPQGNRRDCCQQQNLCEHKRFPRVAR